MAKPKSAATEGEISRDRLAELLNEDFSREYQAIIAYVVYSQVLSGAQIYGHCRQAGNPRQAGARSCPDPLPADRLFRQNASGHSQAGTHEVFTSGHAGTTCKKYGK
jgi:hypothetical protein